MIRRFSKLGDTATLKNNGDRTVGVVPYGSRTVATSILPNDEFEFEISSASKSLYYYKQQTDSIKAVGLYDDGGEPSTKLSFETVPFEYRNLTEKQKEEVGNRDIPLFSFTNIKSRDLSDNEVYLTANVYIDLNVGNTIRTNPVYHSGEDNYRGAVFEVTPDVVFDSHYVREGEGSLTDQYFQFEYYDEGETEYDPVTCKYDINIYIAEKRVEGDDTYYTIKEKATNTINAYFLGQVGFSIIQGDFEYGIDKQKVFVEFSGEDDGQSIEWETSESKDGPDLTRLLYGHSYRVHAYSTDELLVIDSVGDGEIDIQDTTINYPQDIINFSKDMRVWIINNHIKPVENVYVKDEASDVVFYLFRQGSVVSEGQSLEIGQSYSVGWIMMPLSEPSDIYINGVVIAENVKFYEFVLTEDMVVNNQVVIKVVRSQQPTERLFEITNSGNQTINVFFTEEETLDEGVSIKPDNSYTFNINERNYFYSIKYADGSTLPESQSVVGEFSGIILGEEYQNEPIHTGSSDYDADNKIVPPFDVDEWYFEYSNDQGVLTINWQAPQSKTLVVDNQTDFTIRINKGIYVEPGNSYTLDESTMYGQYYIWSNDDGILSANIVFEGTYGNESFNKELHAKEFGHRIGNPNNNNDYWTEIANGTLIIE